MLSKTEKVKNIMAFLAILFGEKEFMSEIMEFHPDYIIEKFERYVLSQKSESEWGMHTNLKKEVFYLYCKKWKLEE